MTMRFGVLENCRGSTPKTNSLPIGGRPPALIKRTGIDLRATWIIKPIIIIVRVKCLETCIRKFFAKLSTIGAISNIVGSPHAVCIVKHRCPTATPSLDPS